MHGPTLPHLAWLAAVDPKGSLGVVEVLVVDAV